MVAWLGWMIRHEGNIGHLGTIGCEGMIRCEGTSKWRGQGSWSEFFDVSTRQDSVLKSSVING